MSTIIIAPLAVPGGLSQAAERAIKSADTLFLQTDRHPSADWVLREGLRYVSMDDLYAQSEDFDALNAAIARRLAACKSEKTVYAVPGRGVGQAQLRAILDAAKSAGKTVERLPSTGYYEAALCAVEDSEALAPNGTILLSASDLSERALNPHLALCVEELDTRIRAGEVKLMLGEFYPDEFPVWFCTLTQSGEYRAKSIPLYALDRQSDEDYFAATTIILRPAGFTERERFTVEDLMDVMRRLRAPGGCPWDAGQTHETLKQPLLEEAYEVLDALIREDMDALCEELGDLLLQIVFHTVLEEEKSVFTLRDVATGIVKKLVYRHPHVFGNAKVKNADEVLVNWDALKMKEKHFETQSDVIDAIPRALPALMRSAKVQAKAAKVGFDWDTPEQALEKVYEEAAEVREALSGANQGAIFEELGDLLFACVNVARLAKTDPELALSAATDKFAERFRKMEEIILADGKALNGMSLQEMDEYWARAK